MKEDTSTVPMMIVSVLTMNNDHIMRTIMRDNRILHHAGIINCIITSVYYIFLFSGIIVHTSSIIHHLFISIIKLTIVHFEGRRGGMSSILLSRSSIASHLSTVSSSSSILTGHMNCCHRQWQGGHSQPLMVLLSQAFIQSPIGWCWLSKQYKNNIISLRTFSHGDTVPAQLPIISKKMGQGKGGR